MPQPISTLPAYAELHCLSNYTFLRGASHPEELVARAAQLGYEALALSDECSISGVVKAHAEAKKNGLHLIIGSSFTVKNANGSPAVQIVVLVKNREGYQNLCRLISLARQRAPTGQYTVSLADFDTSPFKATHNNPLNHNLSRLSGCFVLLVPEYGVTVSRLDDQARWVSERFTKRSYLALTLHHRAQDSRHKALLNTSSNKYRLPLVATGQVEMHIRSRKPLHDVLCAIRLKSTVKECGYHRAPNAEHHLRSRLRLANLYPADLLQATVTLAKQCHFNLDQLHYQYPAGSCPSGTSPSEWLRQQTYQGARWRFPNGIPPAVKKQLEHELQLIANLGYEAYFLTVYDIVQFARKRGILCQGRGSAANSAVCYCLGITEVDPARSNLLFERFISKERNEPPDIDVDFEHHRREEVIQYIYQHYGHDHAALTAVVISYRSKSALRDVGKALGFEAALIEQLTPLWHYRDSSEHEATLLKQCGLSPQALIVQQWLTLARQIIAFPRHLSQHPGGFVLSSQPLHHLVPIENAAMQNRQIVQWDKDDLDTLGILKVDVLGLGMLSAIKQALAYVSNKRGKPFTLQDIPAEDSATYDMLCQADSIGVFQVESRAQMSMLARLRPRSFYDLVIQIAIVRPGPIQGGMVHPYLRRRQGLEAIDYPGPALKKALGRTLGVPIFQEQVMQIAMLAAGFSAGQADELRRAMAAWRRKGTLHRFRDQLINGMISRGYRRQFAEQTFQQIQGFGEYGFPESHAASFALLAYASAWLKRHEPAAFLAALLNCQPMGFYSPSSLIQDAQRHHVIVLPPVITHSTWLSRLEETNHSNSPAVRIGFKQIKGLSKEAGLRIEKARKSGPFLSVQNLAQRANLNPQQVKALATANALSPLTKSRHHAQWEAAVSTAKNDLLQTAPISEQAPSHLRHPNNKESLIADYQALGFTLGPHPLHFLRSTLQQKRFLTAAELRQQPNRRISRACGLVTARQRPATASGVVFVTLDDEPGQINLIVRPTLAQQQRRELVQAQLLGAYGSWQAVDNVGHLLVARLVDLSHLLDDLPAAKSRDFH